MLYCRVVCGQLFLQVGLDGLVVLGFSVACRCTVHVFSDFLQTPLNGVELAFHSVQYSAARVLEVAEEVGVVVRGRSGVMGDWDVLLAAYAHASGVSRAGGGVCADVCPPGLEVELCGNGAPHSRTRKEDSMKQNIQQVAAATTRKIRAIRFEARLCTVATTKDSLEVQLEGTHTPISFGQTGDNH